MHDYQSEPTICAGKPPQYEHTQTNSFFPPFIHRATAFPQLTSSAASTAASVVSVRVMSDLSPPGR